MHCPPCTPLRYRCDAKYWLQGAEADALRECAAAIVEYQNKERTEDVLRIAAFALGVPLERLEGAQLLWLDRLGIYLFAATIGGEFVGWDPLDVTDSAGPEYRVYYVTRSGMARAIAGSFPEFISEACLKDRLHEVFGWENQDPEEWPPQEFLPYTAA